VVNDATVNRTNGAVLYACTAAVLAAGATWWFASAPAAHVDEQMTAWRATVEASVPDRSDQVDAQTTLIGPEQVGTVGGEASPGPYRLLLVCAGRGQVRVRLSTTGDDSGRAIPCSDAPVPVELAVGLADAYFLGYSAEVPNRVAFRWQLSPA
jgi:hypothetical protein